MSYTQTLLPQYLGIVQAANISFYNSSTNILSAVGNYLAELNQNIQFEKAKVTPNLIVSMGKLFNILNENDFTVNNYNAFGTITGQKQMDNSFILYFIEKYQSLQTSYQQRISALISNNMFFNKFSDDIGNIADTISVLDNNTNPYFDVFGNNYFLNTNIPASLFNKVSRNELAISKRFSMLTDALLKTNLKGLQHNVNVNTAATSHGQNLVTDVLYYNRAIVNQIQILSGLQQIFGAMTEFILFFKQINVKDLDPDRAALFFKFTQTVEGVKIRVDALQNVLNKVQQSTQDVLASV